MDYPIVFCSHLTRAVLAGKKVLTIKCQFSNTPTYQVGDTLWVQEIWNDTGGVVSYLADKMPDKYDPNARIDMSNWKSANTMTKDKSRINLEITGVSSILLNTVNDQIAIDSGMLPPSGVSALTEFKKQWDDMYMGDKRWNGNPMCWKIDFKKV